MYIKAWLWGLFGALVTGVATGLGAVAIGPSILKEWNVLWPVMVSGGLVGVLAYLKRFPWPEPKWDGTERRDPAGTVVPVILLCALALSAAGCHPAIDPKTNPVGATAFYAKEMMDAVNALQKVVITAEESKALPTNTARDIMLVTKQMGEKAVALSSALSEIDKFPVADPARADAIGRAGYIIGALNELAFKVVIPPGGMSDARTAIGEAATVVSKLCMTLSGKLH